MVSNLTEVEVASQMWLVMWQRVVGWCSGVVVAVTVAQGIAVCNV